MRKLFLILLVTHFCVLPARGEEGTYKLYKKVHADGSIEFTDKPAKGYEEILVREPLQYKGKTSNFAKTKKDKAADYESLELIAPEDGATFRNLQSPIEVKLRLVPSLKPKHALHLFVDGQQRGDGFRTSSYQLSGLDRGTYRIFVRVLDDQNQSQIESESITLQVHKTSAADQEVNDEKDGEAPPDNSDNPSSSFSKPNPKVNKQAPASNSFGGNKP